LTKIQKNKEEALKQLDIKYVNWDKAKKSFGFIGITFLAVLCGSIFGNDFMKLLIHYFGRLRDWQRKKKNEEQIKAEETKNETVLELEQIYEDKLEESLDKIYFKLVKAKANNNKWRNKK